MRDFQVDLPKLAGRLKNPYDVQQIIYSIEYVSSETMKSAQIVWETGSGHCLEAVHLAAAIMEKKNYPPLALSLDSRDNICHVVYAFKVATGWGSIGRSREIGLHGRAPIFRSVRDLAWSYFDPYVDDTGKLTGYALVNLDDSGSDWRTSGRNVWKSEKFILSVKHQRIFASKNRYRRASRAFTKGEHEPRDYWW